MTDLVVRLGDRGLHGLGAVMAYLLELITQCVDGGLELENFTAGVGDRRLDVFVVLGAQRLERVAQLADRRLEMLVFAVRLGGHRLNASVLLEAKPLERVAQGTDGVPHLAQLGLRGTQPIFAAVLRHGRLLDLRHVNRTTAWARP